MTPELLIERWEDLSSTPCPSGVDRRLLSLAAPVDIYACVFWPGGGYGLLIEGDGAERPADERLAKCRGVRVIHRVDDGPPPRTHMQIALEDRRFVGIFAVLCADLVERAAGETTPASALKTCLNRLSLWQALFERVPAEGLSEEAQRGLFGELAILETMLLQTLDPIEAISAWTGPEPKNQDFIHSGSAIEVKSSLAKRHSRLVISNEKQLDETPHQTLFLAHVRLDESASQGETLPALVKKLRDLLSEDAPAFRLFDDRLMAGGYLDVHARLYGSSWKVSSIRYYTVEGDFPRLTEANLPAGVGDIRYSIVADDLGAFEVDRDVVVTSLGG